MRVLKYSTAMAASGWAVALDAATALAEAGRPRPWQLGLQDMVTPAGVDGAAFHDLLMVVITAIGIFVLGLLIYVMIRFNAKSNPIGSTVLFPRANGVYHSVVRHGIQLVPIEFPLRPGDIFIQTQ